jgi:hypothetical protein
MKLTVVFQTCYMWKDLRQVLGEERAERLRRNGAFGRAKKSDKGEIYYEEPNFTRWAKKIVREAWK